MTRTLNNSIALIVLLATACSGSDSNGRDDDGLDGRQVAGGNSGTEGGSQVGVSCPCDALGVYLRATVRAAREVDGDDAEQVLSLEVEEVLYQGNPRQCPVDGWSPAPVGGCLSDEELPLQTGDAIEARWDGGLPCYFGTTTINVGDEALVTFAPSIVEEDNCDAEAPEGLCCDEEEWRVAEELAASGDPRLLEDCRWQCDDQGNPICRRVDWARGEVKLTHWDDQLLLARTDGGNLTIDAAAVTDLWSYARSERAACYAEYGDFSELPGVTHEAADGVVDCVYGSTKITCDAPAVKGLADAAE